jgi:hypothetical protein
VPYRVEPAKLRHDPLKEGFISKAQTMLVHQHGMRAAQLDDPGIDACRGRARRFRRNGV